MSETSKGRHLGWMAFPGNVPVCRDCGTDWQPVRRGECIACGSDAGPLPTTPVSCDHEWLDRPESDTRQCLICGADR